MTDPSEPGPTDGAAPESADAPRERVIELSVEVAGTPEEVWAAIATGPGITSWYVPTTVEEHLGGPVTNRFGEGPEMLVPGVVTAWEPPRRVAFGGGEESGGLVFEWLVEARDSGSCVVRLVNSGFVEGAPWDDQYDAMTEGWKIFLVNLQLHLAHFAGRTATSMLPTAVWPMSPDHAWSRLTGALGLPTELSVGSRIVVDTPELPPLNGTVAVQRARWVAVVLDAPAAGTAFLACEGMGEACGVSVWQYLYGDQADEIARRDAPRWTAWLEAQAEA